MELYQLRAFRAIADTGQLTRAADRLHLSQPAVSAQLRALEDDLGQQLFERSSNGMTLTRVGEELLALADKVIAAASELKKAAHAHGGGPAGRLRIGTLSDPQFIRLGDFLARAIERYPLIEIELHNDFSGAAFQGVKSGVLDASFYFGAIEHASVTGLRLGDVHYRVAGPAAWGERIRNADWPAIAALPWIVAPDNSTRNQLLDAEVARHRVGLAKAIEADNEGVITNLVESGVGVSLIREDLATECERAGTMAVWQGARLSAPLWFIYPSDRAIEPEIAALIEVLRETWGLVGAAAIDAGVPRRPRVRRLSAR